MEKNKFNCVIHLQRQFVNKPTETIQDQRLSYDLTEQTPDSISEIGRVLNYFSARSNGEFKYWITGDYETSSDSEYCQELAKEYQEQFKERRSIEVVHEKGLDNG